MAKRKYIKLKGWEVPTEASAKRAAEFMRWYGERFDEMRREWLYASHWDDEVATDTAIYIHECIALKGLEIRGRFKWYFLRAYHMRLLAERQRRAKATRQTVYLDDDDTYLDIAAPTFNVEAYEAHIDALTVEMLEWVRANYPPLDVSLFEIYIALQPAVSYKKLARMLGYPAHKIWPAIGSIRRGLEKHFSDRSGSIVSGNYNDTF